MSFNDVVSWAAYAFANHVKKQCREQVTPIPTIYDKEIRRDLANLSRSSDSCSSLILLGRGQKLSPLESTQISASFRYFDDKLTTVSFWSLFISLCLVNLRFRLVISSEVTDDSDGIFLFVLIPSLKNFFRCFSRHFRLWILRMS